jgi:hypothetical protein
VRIVKVENIDRKGWANSDIGTHAKRLVRFYWSSRVWGRDKKTIVCGWGWVLKRKILM